MFTVNFRNWNNNFSTFDTPEPYSTFEEAEERADLFMSLQVEYMGNNCYNQNGTETWVEDVSGKRIYDGVPVNPETNPFL